jgi:hypothetical protein
LPQVGFRFAAQHKPAQDRAVGLVPAAQFAGDSVVVALVELPQMR